jgi:hypothetical protein
MEARRTLLDELLTPEELAKALRVPLSFIYDHSRQRSQDPLPVIKVGKYNRYDAAAVRAHLERRTRSTKERR